MFKSYRFRIYPNRRQLQVLTENFGCSRFVYNQLVERQDKLGPVSKTMERQLIDQLSAEHSWLRDANPSVLFHAFDNYNTTLKRSKALNRRLRFKKSTGRESFCLTNFRQAVHISPRSVNVHSIGELRARMPRLPVGQIFNVTLIKAGSGRYYLSVLTRQSDLPVVSVTQKNTVRCIGIDMGITSFLTKSDGTSVENPRYFQEDLHKLKLLQKGLKRKTHGSSNYVKHCRRIARQHERIVSRRNAFLHKISTQLVRENDIIAVEKLGISDMLGEKQLSVQISDAAWNKFISMLAYKSTWYGKKLIQIDRYHPSSKTCCKCRHKLADLPRSTRQWQCPACETQHDRDTNAAINIMIQGVKIYLKDNPSIQTRQKLIPVLSDRR